MFSATAFADSEIQCGTICCSLYRLLLSVYDKAQPKDLNKEHWQQGFVSSQGLCGWLLLRPPTLVNSSSQDSGDLPGSVFCSCSFNFWTLCGSIWIYLDLFGVFIQMIGKQFIIFFLCFARSAQDLAAHHFWPYGHQRWRGEIRSLWISDAGARCEVWDQDDQDLRSNS